MRWKERHFGAPVLFMLRPEGIIIPFAAKNRQSQPDGAELPSLAAEPARASDLSSKPDGEGLLGLIQSMVRMSQVPAETKQAPGIEDTSPSIDWSKWSKFMENA